MHSRDVGVRYDELLDEKHKEIVVVGGNKSAIDVINACAVAGKTVHWLIRGEGNGATMLLEVRKLGIHGAVFGNGRWSSIPSLSIMSTDSFWYRFLHSGKSRLGTHPVQTLPALPAPNSRPPLSPFLTNLPPTENTGPLSTQLQTKKSALSSPSCATPHQSSSTAK
jgi:hypothetical protein